MKKIILTLGLIAISMLIISCNGQGNLIVADFDYAQDYNLINYGRQVELTLILKNTGDKHCLLNNAESLSFWNVNDPGLSGRYKQHLNIVIPPGSDYVLKIHPYLRDGDILQSNKKDFEIILGTTEGCIVETPKITGFLNIEIENPQVREENNSGIVMNEEFDE